MSRLWNLALSPWVILASLVGGGYLGTVAPGPARDIAFVGQVYLELMQMVVLPFMLSAVMLSVQRLMQEGGAGRLLGRLVLVFVGCSALVALVGAAALLTLRPGTDLPPQTLASFGVMVGGDLEAIDTRMELRGQDVQPAAHHADLGSVLLRLVPSNIFAALTADDTLQVLVFSLLFGLALGGVSARAAEGLDRTLDAVAQGCQRLMRWLNLLLPPVLFCTSAGQVAKTGLEPLLVMSEFVAALAAASAAILAVALLVVWRRCGLALGATVAALRGPFALAIATRNSAVCMPIMIESLTGRLGLARTDVELLVPLSVSLLRLGPVVYYVAATLFVAQLYGLDPTPGDVLLVLAASVLAGLASAGMTGLAIVSLTGMTCGYLGLPFEAAFVLFLAIDPVCDILRTLVIVIGDTAAVTLICPRTPREETLTCAA